MEQAHSTQSAVFHSTKEFLMNHPQYFIGIDIASTSFTSAVLTAPGQLTLAATSFENSPDGFRMFHQWLSNHAITPENSAVCMEATGVYGEALCYFLAAQGYRLAVEPPLKVKRAFKQAGHKTDAVDSVQIAEYAHRFFDELNFWMPKNTILEQIKVLLAAREQFSTQLVANTMALKTLQRKHIQTPRANQAYQVTIEHLQEQIHDIDQEIKRLIDEDPMFRHLVALMISIPGVGMLLASNLLVLTQGFINPVSAKQLAAHAGICPYQHLSGSSVYKRPRSRRYGPSMLRKLLYLSALSLRTHNLEFQKYFLRKVTEGKSKRLVINNISNKLLKIICAVVSSKTQFIPCYRSVNPALLKSA